MERSAQLARSARDTCAGVPLADARSVAEAWLDARARCDLDRLATLTGSRAVWHTSESGSSIGRGAVLERVRSEFANRADNVTTVLALYAAPIVVLALTSESSRREDERENSLRTLLFFRIDGDRVVEIWSTPPTDSTLTRRPRYAPPSDEAADRQRRRRIVRELAV